MDRETTKEKIYASIEKLPEEKLTLLFRLLQKIESSDDLLNDPILTKIVTEDKRLLEQLAK